MIDIIKGMSDGAQAIDANFKELALAINNVKTVYSNWKNVPLAAGYSTGDSNTPQYRLITIQTSTGAKTFAEFKGAISGTFTSTSNSTVATMPAGARPTVPYYDSTASNNGNGGRMSILTNGSMLQVSSSANANPDYVTLSDIFYEVAI